MGLRAAALPGDVRQVMERFLQLVDEAVPGRVVSFYLYGSLCHGDYVAGWSDVDHLLVLDGPATAENVARVTAVYEQVSREFPEGEYLGYVLPGARKDGFCFVDELGPGVLGDPLLLEDFLTSGILVRGRELRQGLARPDRAALVEAAVPSELRKRLDLGLLAPVLSDKERRVAYGGAQRPAADATNCLINAARARLLLEKGIWVAKGETAERYAEHFSDGHQAAVAKAVELRRRWSEVGDSVDRERLARALADFLDHLWRAVFSTYLTGDRPAISSDPA